MLSSRLKFILVTFSVSNYLQRIQLSLLKYLELALISCCFIFYVHLSGVEAAIESNRFHRLMLSDNSLMVLHMNCCLPIVKNQYYSDPSCVVSIMLLLL